MAEEKREDLTQQMWQAVAGESAIARRGPQPVGSESGRRARQDDRNRRAG
jgi:hypothetical protein